MIVFFSLRVRQFGIDIESVAFLCDRLQYFICNVCFSACFISSVSSYTRERRRRNYYDNNKWNKWCVMGDPKEKNEQIYPEKTLKTNLKLKMEQKKLEKKYERNEEIMKHSRENKRKNNNIKLNLCLVAHLLAVILF